MYPNIKIQIFRKGIHQNQLARILGIHETLLSKIIRGYREPSEAQRRKLAEYLQVSEQWLFDKFEMDLPSGMFVNNEPKPGTRDE